MTARNTGITVDFVIPHMGRPELLEQTLASIVAQNAFDQVASITVVSKNEEPLALQPRPKLNVLYYPKAHTISEQRNLGAAQGSAPYLAFLDADIQLDPHWLNTCLALLQADPQRVLVSAMQKTAEDSTQVEWLRTTLSNVATDVDVGFLPGRNLLVSRRLHNQVGGFPEHLQTCEDYYYTDQLAQLGRLHYTSQSHYYHLGEDTDLRQTFRKEIWRSEYNLRSVLGRKIPLREWPSVLLPFWVALFSLTTLVSLFIPGYLLASAGLMLLPTLMYGARLLRHRPPQLHWSFPFRFYAVYFWARALGTLKGTRHLVKGSHR
ncbi:MAG: glycosyltransferase family 2 protein [Saccharospirillum sp.]